MADRWRRSVLSLATALACGSSPLQAAATGAADFLEIPVGGRPAAMGGAYSALAQDAYAPVWNPSGLGRLPATQAAAMHLDYADSVGYEFLSLARPLTPRDGLGASVQYLHPKSAVARDETGAQIGTFSSYYGAYALAYGHGFGSGLSLGGAVKVVDARIGDVSGRAVAGDVGGLYRVGPRLSVAAVAANLGSKMRFIGDGQSLPDTYRLGLVLTPLSSVSLAAESVYDRADSAYGRFGAEWRPLPLIALRAGYHNDATSRLDGLTGLTTGVGLTALGQRFDYAWAPMGMLGDTQYFSLLLTFGSKTAAPRP